jgi:hypothetical protein
MFQNKEHPAIRNIVAAVNDEQVENLKHLKMTTDYLLEQTFGEEAKEGDIVFRLTGDEVRKIIEEVEEEFKNKEK